MTESLWQSNHFIYMNRDIKILFPVPILTGEPSEIPRQQSH